MASGLYMLIFDTVYGCAVGYSLFYLICTLADTYNHPFGLHASNI